MEISSSELSQSLLYPAVQCQLCLKAKVKQTENDLCFGCVGQMTQQVDTDWWVPGIAEGDYIQKCFTDILI